MKNMIFEFIINDGPLSGFKLCNDMEYKVDAKHTREKVIGYATAEANRIANKFGDTYTMNIVKDVK